jgi:uncharacterized protein YgiM (DUF1202 family)
MRSKPFMRSIVVAAGCMSLALAAHAQTSTAPSQPLPTPPPLVEQPGNAGNTTSNLADMTVTRNGTAVREEPNDGSQLLASLNEGTKVLAIGTAGGWTHVIVGGTDGYVNAQSLK